MKRFATVLRQFIPKIIEKPLGRWNYEKSKNRLDQKIDLSNEDHCGPCGQYALSKTFSKNIDYKKE